MTGQNVLTVNHVAYDPWKELGAAVVAQVAKDWIRDTKAIRRIKKSLKEENLDEEAAKREIFLLKRYLADKKDAEEFFTSSAIELFTDLDGKKILKKLEEKMHGVGY